MTWAGIKKGDAVLEVYGFGGRTERVTKGTVQSVGRRWIATRHHEGGPVTKYDAETGYGEFGWHLHTEATLADLRAREAALDAIRACTQYGVHSGKVPTDALVRAAAILRGDA